MKKRKMEFWFPILAPMLLAFADYFFRVLPATTLPDFVSNFRGLGLAVIFGCFTIDIWG